MRIKAWWHWYVRLQRLESVPLLRRRLVDALARETDELVRIFARSIQTAGRRKW
jgi:hypothetical protein